MEIVRLENWKLVEANGAQATSPKLAFRLRGQVYGHPIYPDGDKLTTSEILKVEGNIAHCKSRSYILGDPADEYVKSLQAKGLQYDAEDPLKLMKLKGD